jgi:putative peptide zinc metalloprotease protein
MSAAPTTAPSLEQTAHSRLRSDLRVTVDADGAFIVEDPVRTQFFRLGPSEYRVVSYLDGRTSLREAAQRAAEHGTTLAQWLLATNLVVAPATGQATPPPAASNPSAGFNFCYWRIPISAGGQALVALTTLLGWLFSWPAALAVAVLTLAAAWQVGMHWTTFTSSLQRVLCPDQHLVLAACWLVLKLAHELGHGIASKRFGGDVREFGVAMIFFVPVPYSDVTASWRCTRWERMAVAAAGMYLEWILALIAVAVWSWSANPVVRQVSVYVVSLATLTTILFNANPLCRMDGYYLLSDFLGWPNLAAQGQRISQAWLSWLLLGQTPPSADTAPRRYLAIGCYGLAARLWRSLSLLTMGMLVVLIYEGLGILFLVGITVGWQSKWLAWRTLACALTQGRTPRNHWVVLRLAVLALVVAAIWWCVPWPGGISAPGTLENVARHVVRTSCPSQVLAVRVENGQTVTAGQEIAELSSDVLALELAELESAFAQGMIKQRSQRTKRQLVDLQVETRRQESLAKRLEDCRRKLRELTLRAPIAGRVIARRLADLPGSYLAEGAEICSIVSDEHEFRILVTQQDVPAFAARFGTQLHVSFPGQQATGVLVSLEPQASTVLADMNLGANVGGPLAVVPNEAQTGHADDAASWKLSEPRIIGHVQLTGTQTPLLVGQRGYVSLRPLNYTVGQRISNVINEWLQRLSRQSRDSLAQK